MTTDSRTTGAAQFDCPDIYAEHAFLLRLTRGRDARAVVTEVFGRAPTEREPSWAPETVLRCEAPRAAWDAVAGEARAEFNRRLRADGKPLGRWGAEETAVQRLFGKELLVLLWAIEMPDVLPEEIGVAVRNWLGLKPEERWWLYTMTAAGTGLAQLVKQPPRLAQHRFDGGKGIRYRDALIGIFAQRPFTMPRGWRRSGEGVRGSSGVVVWRNHGWYVFIHNFDAG